MFFSDDKCFIGLSRIKKKDYSSIAAYTANYFLLDKF